MSETLELIGLLVTVAGVGAGIVKYVSGKMEQFEEKLNGRLDKIDDKIDRLRDEQAGIKQSVALIEQRQTARIAR